MILLSLTFYVKSFLDYSRLAVVNLSNGGIMPALVAMQCKEEPPSVFNNNSSTTAGNTNIISASGSTPTSVNGGGRPTILEHIEEHNTSMQKDSSPHVSRVSKKRRERKTPFSRVREQPDINADEAIFDTLDAVSNVTSSSLDRSSNWSTVLHRHKRQASADRIPPQASAASLEQPQTQPLIKSENTYRQQMIIPDDTNTTIVNTSFEENTTQCSTSYTLVNPSIEESSNFMEEASNHSTAVVMGDRTVTSPTSQFGNLSFATTQVSQEPVSFAGMRNFPPIAILRFNFSNIFWKL